MAAEIPAIHHTEGAPTSALSGPRVQEPASVVESPASDLSPALSLGGLAAFEAWPCVSTHTLLRYVGRASWLMFSMTTKLGI